MSIQNQNKQINKGVYISLITPFYKGKFDNISIKKLMEVSDPNVTGFMACLSTGEGSRLSKIQWMEIIKAVRSLTKKPVIAGIEGKDFKDIIELANYAKKINCEAVMVPVLHQKEEEIFEYVKKLSNLISLPIVLYNTEKYHIKDIKLLHKISQFKNIIGIKDSSSNQSFFQKACKLRSSDKLNIAIFQGLENQLSKSVNSDGFMIALPNVESKLCKDIFTKNSKKLENKTLDIFWKYNLGGSWYVSLKAILFSKNIIRSAEEVLLEINP